MVVYITIDAAAHTCILSHFTGCSENDKHKAMHSYPAHDIALCTDCGASAPLPCSCHASKNALIIKCTTISELHFMLGFLYIAVPHARALAYCATAVAPHIQTKKIGVHMHVANMVSNTRGKTAYLDMLINLRGSEMSIIDDEAYACVALVQRYYSSHAAHVLCIDKHTDTQLMLNAHEALLSMPPLRTDSSTTAAHTPLAVMLAIDRARRFSFTRRSALYRAVCAAHIRGNNLESSLKDMITILRDKKTYSDAAAFDVLMQACDSRAAS